MTETPSLPPRRPDIRAVQWLPARDVLPREADDFTPWLADNLDLLAGALGLRTLEAITTESAVGDYRLDILARGVDGDGREIPVCIENQYGGTDHKHLGQLVTYLAKESRGLAVWIVEEASASHVAAIEFLNRTSDESVGYCLVRARFMPGPADSYQVHFEVLERPNAFTRERVRRGASTDVQEPTKGRAARKAFLTDVLVRVRDPLLAAGFPSINVHASGSYVWIRWPPSLFIAQLNRGYLHLRVNRTDASVNVNVNAFDTREANSAALDVLRDRYGERLTRSLGPDVGTDWHAGQGADSDRLSIVRDGEGYEGGEVAVIAAWLQDTTIGVLDLFRSDPMTDVETAVSDRLARGGAPQLAVDSGYPAV